MSRSECFGIAAIVVGNTFFALAFSVLATPGIGATGNEWMLALLYFEFFIVVFAILAARSLIKTGQGLGIAAFALPASIFVLLAILAVQAGWLEFQERQCAKSTGKWDNIRKQCSEVRR